MLINDFNATISTWIKALDETPLTKLCIKPTAASWSLAQLYQHLIDDTCYYIEQMEPCLTSNDNAAEEMNASGKKLFLANTFPDTMIVGHPNNAFIPQPESKEQLVQSLQKIKDAIDSIWMLIQQTPFKGKSLHPGFGYLSAAEWFQFAEIHFRHHFRQKKRLDDFISKQ